MFQTREAHQTNVGGGRVHDGLGGDPVCNDQHGRQLKAGCWIHSRSYLQINPSLINQITTIQLSPQFRKILNLLRYRHKSLKSLMSLLHTPPAFPLIQRQYLWAGTCVDRLCGEVFCSVTSSAAGGNSSSHCPVYSYIRPFTLRCQTALARLRCSFCLVLSCLALEPNPQAPLWQWRGDGRLPGKGVVISNKNTNVFWENLKPKAYWWQTFWFGWYFVVLNFFAGRETGDSAWTTCSSLAPARNVFLMLSSVENMPQQTL